MDGKVILMKVGAWCSKFKQGKKKLCRANQKVRQITNSCLRPLICNVQEKPRSCIELSSIFIFRLSPCQGRDFFLPPPPPPPRYISTHLSIIISQVANVVQRKFINGKNGPIDGECSNQCDSQPPKHRSPTMLSHNLSSCTQKGNRCVHG